MKRPKNLDEFARFPEDTAEGMSCQDACAFARFAVEMEKRNSEAMDALPASVKFDSYGDLREPLGWTLDIIAGARRRLLGERA